MLRAYRDNFDSDRIFEFVKNELIFLFSTNSKRREASRSESKLSRYATTQLKFIQIKLVEEW